MESQQYRQALNQIRGLSDEEQIDLACEILDKVTDSPLELTEKELEGAWAEEAERRMRLIQSGELESIPWEEARERLWGN